MHITVGKNKSMYIYIVYQSCFDFFFVMKIMAQLKYIWVIHFVWNVLLSNRDYDQEEYWK